MPAPPGCIWVSLIERPCSCVIPGEPGDTAARAARRVAHVAGRRYRHRAPRFSERRHKNGGKKKKTNGEFSPVWAFSDNSSCASAGPGRGSIPVNHPKPSAIQIACGGNWYNRMLVRAGRGPLLAPCFFLPGHERREEQDVFPALSFPIPAARGLGSDKKKGGREGQMLVPRSCCDGKDGAGGPPAAKSSLIIAVVPTEFKLGSVSAGLAAPASSLPRGGAPCITAALPHLFCLHICIFSECTAVFFCSVCSAKHGCWCSQPPPRLQAISFRTCCRTPGTRAGVGGAELKQMARL